MSTGRHAFKHRDAARLIRAVEAAGKRITGVTLDGSTGKVTVSVEDAAASSVEDAAASPKRNAAANPWDSVLTPETSKPPKECPP